MRRFNLYVMVMILSLMSGTGFAQSNLAVVDGRIAALEAEIQRLTGKIEEQSFKIRELENELNRRMSDAELRLSDLEQRPAPSTTTANSDINAPTNPAYRPSNENILNPPPSASQEDTWRAPQSNNNILNGSPSSSLYEKAFATLRNGDYDTAEVQFKEFLDAYPNDNLASNAKYWLAETYYVRNNFEKASQGFAQAYQADPKGSKAADNLLKLGLSLAGLGKNEDACIAFSQLLKEYNTAARSVVTRGEREAERLGCTI